MRNKIIGIFVAMALVLSALLTGFDNGKADAAPQPFPTIVPLPSLTALPNPVPTITKLIPVPGPTVTKRIPGPTKTIYKRVPVPGPTVTVYKTRQGPTTRVTVTAKPSPSVSVSPSPVTKVTTKPGKTITISKPKFIGISLGFLVLGIIIAVAALWITYAVGYKDSERNEARSLRDFRDELFGKR